MASPPPPPPPSPPLQQFAAPSEDPVHRDPSSSSSSSFVHSPSLLIIAAILVFVVIASASIHLLLRFLSRSSSSSSSSSAPPLIHHRRSSSASAASAALSDQEKAAIIDSLPLFSLASSVAVLPKSSPDCAVCLSPFQPHDELRLLPACRHAFHSPCIDTWLRSTPSCPLCRSSITLSASDLPPQPQLSPAVASEDHSRSSSFRIEIGSVSRRRTSTEEDPAGAATSLPNPPPPPPHLRSFSLGSSFEYMVDEEVEAVVSRIRRVKEDKVGPAGPPPPGEEVAEAAGGGGRSWLKDYVDRLTSSASSSFSSLRFSGRWSHRYDDGGGGGGGRGSWDLEGNHQQREGEEISDNSFYRGRGEGAREGVLVEKEVDKGGAVAKLPEILVSVRPRTERLMQREREGGMGACRERPRTEKF